MIRTFSAALVISLAGIGQTVSAQVAQPPHSLSGVRFRFHADGPIRGTPVYAAGTIYFGSDDGNFYAVDARSGALRWRYKVGAAVASTPALVGGMAYFTAFDGSLYALDTARGTLRWKAALGRDLGTMNYWDFYTSSPIAAGGTLYVGSGDGHAYAVDRSTGHIRWQHDVGARIRATPAVSDTVVAVGTMSGHVLALDRATGALKWDFATDGAGYDFNRKYNDTTAVPAAPSIQGGLVTAGGRDGNLYAIDLATGKQRWKITHDGGSWILSSQIRGDTVFSGSGSAAIIQSARAADGQDNWRFPTHGAVFGPIAYAGDVLVASDFGGYVEAVDSKTGKGLWQFPLADRPLGGPLVADGAVFAADDSGMLVALDTSGAMPAARPVRHVLHYNFTRPGKAPDWLTNSGGFATGFIDAGYDGATDDNLAATLADQIAGKTDTVIVFADPHLPAALSGDGGAMLRQYLEAGGKAVFLGFNPWSFKFDPATSEMKGLDDDLGAAAIQVPALARPLDYGYHVSTYTPAAERLGLRGQFVTSGAVASDKVDVVLAQDRIGFATAWVKRYGRTGMLLNLPVPRNRLIDMTAIRGAIDLAIQTPPR